MKTRALGTLLAVVVIVAGAPLSRAQTEDCARHFIVAKKFNDLGKWSGVSGLTTIGSDVWAVGSYRSGREDHTFLVKWDGESWNWLPVPTPTRGAYYFTGIDASIPDDVWLAGTKSKYPNDRPVVLRWTDGKWTKMELPHIDSGFLYDVEVISPTDVWAVGSWDTPEPSPTVNPLALHWDGTQWTRRDPPASTRDYIELADVEAGSSTDVWVRGTGGSSPYIVRWDGTGWSRVGFPEYDEEYPRVGGFDVVGPNEVWAAGELETRRYRAQVWRWDGNTFSETSTYNPRGHEFLTDVEMIDETGYAVGNETRGIYNEALVLTWTGEEWVKLSAARPGAESFLGEVDVADDGTVWTSGSYDTGGAPIGMILRSCGPTE